MMVGNIQIWLVILMCLGHLLEASRQIRQESGPLTQAEINKLVYNVSRVIPHPKFNPKTNDNDVALLRLSRQLWIGHYIAPICLPTPSLAIEDTKPTINVWKIEKIGNRVVPRLDYLQVDVISNSQCQLTAFDRINVIISGSQLCAGHLEGGQGPCYTESGGPLMVLNADGRATAIGMLSDPQCGQPGFVDIYIRIASYLGWIKKNAQIK